MRRFRIIPMLLIDNGGLVKGEKFKKRKYVGDPINAVKIFNEKEVDEIAVIDIGASRDGTEPDYALIESIAGEAFMPLSYGGGLTNIEQVRRILRSGVEKVVFNHSAVVHPRLIAETAHQFGSSSTVVSIDVKANLFGSQKVFTLNGEKNTGLDPVEFARNMAALGAGELVLTSIDKEGTRAGFDLKLIRQVAEAVDIPVIANGGAGSYTDFSAAIRHGASAVAAGSLFVFHGPHKAVLISYPSSEQLYTFSL